MRVASVIPLKHRGASPARPRRLGQDIFDLPAPEWMATQAPVEIDMELSWPPMDPVQQYASPIGPGLVDLPGATFYPGEGTGVPPSPSSPTDVNWAKVIPNLVGSALSVFGTVASYQSQQQLTGAQQNALLSRGYTQAQLAGMTPAQIQALTGMYSPTVPGFGGLNTAALMPWLLIGGGLIVVLSVVKK